MNTPLTSENALKILSAQLKAYREDYLELSESEFSQLVNVSEADIKAMESGENITVDRWLRIWDKMGTLKAGLKASIPHKQLKAGNLQDTVTDTKVMKL